MTDLILLTGGDTVYVILLIGSNLDVERFLVTTEQWERALPQLSADTTIIDLREATP